MPHGGYPMRFSLSIALVALGFGLGSARPSPGNSDPRGGPGATASDPEATLSSPSGNDRLDGRHEDLGLRPGAAIQDPFMARTHVSLRGARWCINDEPTNRGTRAEGLLMNVRMVNAVFEDRHKP